MIFTVSLTDADIEILQKLIVKQAARYRGLRENWIYTATRFNVNRTTLPYPSQFFQSMVISLEYWINIPFANLRLARFSSLRFKRLSSFLRYCCWSMSQRRTVLYNIPRRRELTFSRSQSSRGFILSSARSLSILFNFVFTLIMTSEYRSPQKVNVQSFFYKNFVFHLRLHVLIFLRILGWKYSCECSKVRKWTNWASMRIQSQLICPITTLMLKPLQASSNFLQKCYYHWAGG